MKAMIFAAGLGTRLRPLTNDRPKALVELEGQTFLERNILYLKQYGFDEIIVNIHHFGEKMIEFLESKDFGIRIEISDERDMLLDTGGGLKKARHFLEGDAPFLLYNVDILCNIDLKALYDYHLANEAMVTLAVRNRTSSRYLLFDESKRLVGWTNTKTGETIFSSEQTFVRCHSFAFSGIHIVSPQIFEKMEQEGKFSIIEVYLHLAANCIVKAYPHNESIWMDLGTHEKLAKAKALINEQRI